jgi:hypothetical protein
MKQPARKHCVIALAALVIGAAMIGPLTAGRSGATETAQEASATRIETDQDAGHFTFIIDNEPAARLDKDGLHVLDNVTYGGLLIDKNDDVRETLTGKAKSTETKEE